MSQERLHRCTDTLAELADEYGVAIGEFEGSKVGIKGMKRSHVTA